MADVQTAFIPFNRAGFSLVLNGKLPIWPEADAAADHADAITVSLIRAAVTAVGAEPTITVAYLPNGDMVVVTGVLALRAARTLRDSSGATIPRLPVAVVDMSEEDMWCHLAEEVGNKGLYGPITRGYVFLSAAAALGSFGDAARILKVGRAVMSKCMDVARAADATRGVIADQRAISQRDACWLMRIIGRQPDRADAPDHGRRDLVLDRLQAAQPGRAREVFRQLREAAGPDPDAARPGTIVVMDGNERELGTLMPSGTAGELRLRLNTAAAEMPLDEVLDAIREALATLRRQPSRSRRRTRTSSTRAR